MSKYHNQKTFYRGRRYDSKKEAKRAQDLDFMQRAGLISGLQKQVEYLLIPSQYRTVNGKRKCVERPCKYVADFVYWQNGRLVVEDTKGYRTPDYVIKRKLMLQVYDIQIKEV